ncbi:MAG: hypothetical protein K2Y29_07205 [Beijerinckiaceae bacterium]|nr:hypothetical protein [Beijerinckiaceae bacterium]
MRAPVIAMALLSSVSAFAADPAQRESAADTPKAIDIPGDIFGFTSATDTGSVGDRGLALETDGLFGSRDGRYRLVTQKLELSYTFADNWSVAGSVFGAFHNIRNVTLIPGDANGYRFDGLSFEIRHRVIERTATQPFAVTIAAEPRWARVDGAGVRSDLLGVEAKFQVDAPVTERLFWAMNVNIATAGQQDEANNRWSSASASAVSTALAYSLLDGKLFVGAEARWIQGYENTLFGRRTDYAIFVGPTLQAKIADNVSFNATIQPQIAGRNADVPRNQDLDPFDRALFRVKLAVGF